jgi:PTS system fructose-specific IIA component
MKQQKRQLLGDNMKLVKKEHIFIDQDFKTQQEVFEFLAAKTVELGIATDKTEVYQKLQVRENEGTTGMMDGFAIPHAQSTDIHSASIIIVRNCTGIEWKSLDERKSSFIIALFIPSSEVSSSHLKLLSSVARLLMHEDVTSALKSAASPIEIAEILNGKLSENE